MPPSWRVRQNYTVMKTAAISGIAMQCRIYARRSALASTIDPPGSANRASLQALKPSCAPNGPSWPIMGVARAAGFTPSRLANWIVPESELLRHRIRSAVGS